MYRLGVDIGGTKINIGLFDNESKELIINVKKYISEIDSIPEYILTAAKELCKKSGADYSKIAFCGIGIPGTVSEDSRYVLKAPNITKLPDNIADVVEASLGVPTSLAQDSRAAAWGEYLCGAGMGYSTVVCITLGTGIGTGIIMNGKIYSGALGCAGELGHLPVKEGGRACGCGKRGCLEKYCAGGGLDITASELLGEGKTAADLFEAALKGNEAAKTALDEAVSLLGAGLVPVINLLSPDCIVFSGGLSSREEYINPVIDYITSHCYTAGKLPVLTKAALGENSPLYGAAFLPFEPKRKPMLSASVMCADILNMAKALDEIKAAGIEYLHCDIMDNHFVPNLMMPMEFLNKLRTATDLPFDFHIMAENPESVIEKLDIKPGDIISVHYESTNHLQRAVSLIKDRGAMTSVALNPATPLCMLDEILPQLDMVLIMSVNPGFAGQKIVPSSFDKIKALRRLLSERSMNDILIQVDGNCSFENVPEMYDAGADIFVVGTSSVFKKGLTVKEGTEKLLETLKK